MNLPDATTLMERVVLLGAALTAVGYGLRRVYSLARTVEQIFDHAVQDKVHREQLAADLKEHVQKEDKWHDIRDHQLNELAADVREITREIRPNGGTSMKDVLNQTSDMVKDNRLRIAVLEEWKRAETG